MSRLSVRPRLAALGLEPSAAPNSLWLKNPAVDKSLPVHYMVRHADRFGFDLASAVAFGDNPAGETRPLATDFVWCYVSHYGGAAQATMSR